MKQPKEGAAPTSLLPTRDSNFPKPNADASNVVFAAELKCIDLLQWAERGMAVAPGAKLVSYLFPPFSGSPAVGANATLRMRMRGARECCMLRNFDSPHCSPAVIARAPRREFAPLQAKPRARQMR